ncbi:SIS domain-containing protein [Candidatus Parcubacteria bacterium]|nr:SIS domain-containing protein [Candidatus Parcubacteria bacterium]
MIKETAKKYFSDLKKVIDELDLNILEKITEIIHDAYKNDKQIFIMGNGGSAATASHFACDLGKGTLLNNGQNNTKRFRVISLTDNVATMTAWGNDTDYSHIFSDQLKNLINSRDVVIGISASGNSPNVINAINLAKKHNAKTIGFAGFEGGELAKISDVAIVAKINRYDIAEDVHLVLGHLVTRYFKNTINN